MVEDKSLQIGMAFGLSLALGSLLLAKKNEGLTVLMLATGVGIFATTYLGSKKINSASPVIVAGARG